MGMTEYVTKEQAKEADDFYWKLTKERISAATEPIMRGVKKATVLAATGTALGAGGLIAAIFTLTRRRYS